MTEYEAVETPEVQAVINASAKEKPARAKLRTLEELDAVSAKTMSDAERIKYIDGLRDAVATLSTTAEMYKHNCDLAYEKCRMLEQAKDECQMRANAEMAFVRQALDTCHRSIILATRKDG